MACLTLTDGLFINSPLLVWQTTGTDTAGGATVTATATGISVTKGTANRFFAKPGTGSVAFVTFGTPAKQFILILSISTLSGTATRSVNVVNTASPTLEVENVAIYSADNSHAQPIVQRSQGNNSLFCLVMTGTAGVSATMCRSEDGQFLVGKGAFIPNQQIFGEITATLLRIMEGGNPVAAVARPLGECQVTTDPRELSRRDPRRVRSVAGRTAAHRNDSQRRQ